MPDLSIYKGSHVFGASRINSEIHFITKNVSLKEGAKLEDLNGYEQLRRIG